MEGDCLEWEDLKVSGDSPRTQRQEGRLYYDTRTHPCKQGDKKVISKQVFIRRETWNLMETFRDSGETLRGLSGEGDAFKTLWRLSGDPQGSETASGPQAPGLEVV